MSHAVPTIPFGDFFQQLYMLRFSSLAHLADKAGISDTTVMRGLRFRNNWSPFNQQTALDILRAMNAELPLTDAEAIAYLGYVGFDEENARRWVANKLSPRPTSMAAVAPPASTAAPTLTSLCNELIARIGEPALIAMLHRELKSTPAPVPMLKRTTEHDGFRVTEVHPTTPPAPIKPIAKRKTS